MSNYISPFLCPNYEDYEYYGAPKQYLKNWPAMWPEEKYAEGALWQERQEIMRTRPSFFTDYIRWWKNNIPKDEAERIKQRQRIAYALSTLAEDCGWDKKLCEIPCFRSILLKEVYETSNPKDKPKEEAEPLWMQKPKDDGLKIDNELFTQVMGGKVVKRMEHKPTSRKDLIAFALATLANEQDWKRKNVGCYDYYNQQDLTKRIYKTSEL